MSRIGRMPVVIPAGVTVDIEENNKVTVKGPKGTLVSNLCPAMTLEKDGNVYDMIFIDAAKGQYGSYLPVCKKMLRPGGVLISDNVLFDGDIVQSRFAVRRRDRTIHARMREYLRLITEDKELVTTILPIGDGITLSVLSSRTQSGK